MKITAAKVIVCCPGRNFVTLKIETDEGLHGIGDATLNGRELAVAQLSRPTTSSRCLIGRDPRRIEDIWQYLYKGAYWRRGPVTMSAIAAVDMALWDIKAKAAGMPLYQLLGGASRDGVMVYGHANGATSPRRSTRCERYMRAWATRRSARRAACPAWRRSTASAKGDAVLRTGRRATCRASTSGRPRSTCDYVPKLFEARARAARLRRPPAARRAPPPDADRGRAPGQGSGALPPVLAGGRHAGREPGGVPADPPAHHHAARGGRGLQHDLGLQGPDREPADRLHPRAPSSTPAASRTCAASPTWPRSTRCAPAATARPTCRRSCMGAALHFDLWVPNFGIQEYMRHTDETDAVFPHAYTLRGRLSAPRRRARATASTSTRRWPPSTPTSAPTCRWPAAARRHAVELVNRRHDRPPAARSPAY